MRHLNGVINPVFRPKRLMIVTCKLRYLPHGG